MTHRSKSDIPFFAGLGVLAGFYIVLIASMLLAQAHYARLGDFSRILADANIRYAIRLSLLSSTITTVLALWVAVPIAYLLSRMQFPGKNLLDGFLDIPLILPPLVVGLCLLILFRQTMLRARRPLVDHLPYSGRDSRPIHCGHCFCRTHTAGHVRRTVSAARTSRTYARRKPRRRSGWLCFPRPVTAC